MLPSGNLLMCRFERHCENLVRYRGPMLCAGVSKAFGGEVAWRPHPVRKERKQEEGNLRRRPGLEFDTAEELSGTLGLEGMKDRIALKQKRHLVSVWPWGRPGCASNVSTLSRQSAVFRTMWEITPRCRCASSIDFSTAVCMWKVLRVCRRDGLPRSSAPRVVWTYLIEATWLILPVVICLSQRLSHACLSINCFIR